MFFGNYQHNLDDKGRLVIPSKIREISGNRLYIMKGYDGPLSVFREDDFQKLVHKVNSLPFTQKNARDFIRLSLGSVVELEIDKQGRIQIAAKMLNDYHISKEVVIVGVGDHFEIWDAKAWSIYVKENNETYETKAESLNQQE